MVTTQRPHLTRGERGRQMYEVTQSSQRCEGGVIAAVTAVLQTRRLCRGDVTEFVRDHSNR